MASTPVDGIGRSGSPTPSQLPPLPSSPTYSYASTANPISSFNLPPPPPPRPVHAVLTRADLEQSHTAYGDLISSAKTYRLALASLSTAASAFGSALEACARLKEAGAEPISAPATTNGSAVPTVGSGFPALQPPPPRSSQCTADLLLSASGVHQLIANHQQILSETVYRSFEVPLLHELDKWRRFVDEEEETYRAAVAVKSAEIRRMEKDGLWLHRQKRRDVTRFRAHLVELTTKLDGLTTLHGEHARTLLRESQDTSVKILDASCSLVRAEVDIFESLARKGWSGGGLEDLLEKGVDLFASEPDSSAHTESSKLFSILPPKSILADTTEAPRPGHVRGDSLLDTTYQSLAAVAAEQQQRAADAESISDFNRPRNKPTFSPQPIRRAPTDVTFDDNLAVGAVQNRVTTHRRDESENGLGLSLTLSLGPTTREEEDDEDDHRDGGEYAEVHDVRDEVDGSLPWRNEGLKRSLSGEIGRDLNSEDDADRGRRWREEDAA